MDLIQQIAIGAGLAWASGIRLYAVVFLAGLLGHFNIIQLPSGLHLLMNPVVLGVSGFMFLLEFFADKVPGFDSIWDAIHTFIRIPAGAILAAATFRRRPVGCRSRAHGCDDHIGYASDQGGQSRGDQHVAGTVLDWMASFGEAAVLGGLWACPSRGIPRAACPVPCPSAWLPFSGERCADWRSGYGPYTAPSAPSEGIAWVACYNPPTVCRFRAGGRQPRSLPRHAITRDRSGRKFA
jgi:hypothetical protein